MIYLIGGAPRCGKTMLSKMLAKKHGLSWISTDTIRAMVLASTPKSEIAKKFPLEVLQQAAEKEHVPYQDFASNTPKRLLRAEIVESKTIWPSVRAMIETLIEAQEDYVIEGVHLLPELVNQLKKTSGWKHVRYVCLVKEDLTKIIEGFSKNPSKHDWLRGALKNVSLVEKIGRVVQSESRHVTAGAKKCGFMVYNTEKNFEPQLSKALRGLRS